MKVDPPPDLAIEIDMTSRTQLDNYRVSRSLRSAKSSFGQNQSDWRI
ncbi:hypothetical protein [Oscillatoria sp. FACHB-1406]|nr:hypothetical protein [Oscillatoria sp. FACHB-1406]